MKPKIPIVKVVGRGPVLSQVGSGLNAQGQPVANVPVAPRPPVRKYKVSGQP